MCKITLIAFCEYRQFIPQMWNSDCISLLLVIHLVCSLRHEGEIYMTNTLRELRKASGLTVNQIVVELNIQNSTLYMWESGDRLIPVDQLNRLLKLYQYPINDFDFDDLIQTHELKKQVKLNA